MFCGNRQNHTCVLADVCVVMYVTFTVATPVLFAKKMYVRLFAATYIVLWLQDKHGLTSTLYSSVLLELFPKTKAVDEAWRVTFECGVEKNCNPSCKHVCPMNEYLRAFVLGSSYPVAVWPFLYIGLPHMKRGRPLPSGLRYETIPLVLPVYYGLWNVLSTYIGKQGLDRRIGTRNRLVLTGALAGFALSLIGRFGYNVPVELFGHKPDNPQVHMLAPIMYGAIFGLVVHYLQYSLFAPKK